MRQYSNYQQIDIICLYSFEGDILLFQINHFKFKFINKYKLDHSIQTIIINDKSSSFSNLTLFIFSKSILYLYRTESLHLKLIDNYTI